MPTLEFPGGYQGGKKLPTIAPTESIPGAQQYRRTRPEDFPATIIGEAAMEFGGTLMQIAERAELTRQSEQADRMLGDLTLQLDEADREIRKGTDYSNYLDTREKAVKTLKGEFSKGIKEFAPSVRTSMGRRMADLFMRDELRAREHQARLDTNHARAETMTLLDNAVKIVSSSPDPETREQWVTGGLAKVTEALERGAITEVEAHQWGRKFQEDLRAGRQRHFSIDLKAELDGYANSAFRDPLNADSYMRQGLRAIEGAGADWMKSEDLAEAKAQFRNVARSGAIKAMIDKDPHRTKAALEAGLYDGDLSQQALISLHGEANTEIDRRERKAEAERKEGVRQIGKTVDDYKNAVMLGFKWAGNESELALAVRGTEHEGEFRNAQSQSRVLGRFNQMAPMMQEQVLRDVRSGAQTGDSAKYVKSLEAAHELTKAQLKLDPLSFAVKQGVVENLPAVRLDDGGLSFRARSQAAGIAEQRYGVPVSPLTDDEAANLLQQLNSAPADGKTAMLRSVTQGLEPRHVKSLAAQFAKQDAGLMAYAMGLSVESPQTASRLLQGHDILKNNKDVLPKGVDMATARSRIASAVGEAFQRNPEHYAAVSEAALNLYALKSWQEQDLSGTIDTKRIDSAIQEATGGVITYKGRTIQAPRYGVNDALFIDFLDRADYSKAKGFSKKDILSHGVLESVGDGRYLVKVGAGYVQGAESGPFILDLGEVVNRGMVGARIGAGVAGLVK